MFLLRYIDNGGYCYIVFTRISKKKHNNSIAFANGCLKRKHFIFHAIIIKTWPHCEQV